MEYSIIPPTYYTHVYYNFILLVLVLDVIKLLIKPAEFQSKKNYKSIALLIIVVLYIGLRPISSVFIDMIAYNYIFKNYASGAEIDLITDVTWFYFMRVCSSIMTAKSFFLICAVLYIFPLYKASKNLLGGNKYILFLMFVASFSFWSYGVNGLRNGIASSLFILAISLIKKKYLKYGLFVLAYLIHGSLIIPVAAYLVTLFYKNTKHFLLVWLLCIPLSLVFGSVFEMFFSSLGFEKDRIGYLTEGNIHNDTFAYIGFRWDFLIYSATAIYAGYYFIIKRKFKDIVYIQLFNLYITANAFWILVINANFSNRFAYLSWFLMALIIFYPFLKMKFFKNQNKVLATTIIGYFGFTYLMFLIT